MSHNLFRGVALAAVALAPACNGDHAIFYDVVQTRTEECAIRSNGEFCAEPEQFSPPVVTVWMIEHTDTVSRVYVDEEVFVLSPLAEGEDPLVAELTGERRAVFVENNCTTTRDETLRVRADKSVLSGSLARKSVVTGPASCGATPSGERSVDALEGSTTTADGFEVGP
jgi:hypothetical protein